MRPEGLRELYRGGRPNEVVGRRTGTVSRLPLAVAWCGGHRYVVAMLGPWTTWVRNVEASRGGAVWEQGARHEVILDPVPVEQRAPILRRYLPTAWSARPPLAVRWNAPLADVEAVADEYLVCRITRAAPGGRVLQ